MEKTLPIDGKFQLLELPYGLGELDPVISEKTLEYADQVNEQLLDAGVRSVLDTSNEKIGYKIRQAQQEDRAPYMLVIGAKEAEAGAVAVRTRDGKDLGAMPLNDFMAMVKQDIAEKH